MDPGNEYGTYDGADAADIDRILRFLIREHEPLSRFLRGNRLEDICTLPRHVPECGALGLSRQAGKVERLHYVLNLDIKTDDFFTEYPDHNTKKENAKFWGEISNPGYRRNGGKREFAARHKYATNMTVELLSRGGKMKAMESELDEPGLVPCLLLITHMLDHISYDGARVLSHRLQQEFPEILSTSRAVRRKWKIYIKCYRKYALDRSPAASGPAH